MCRVIWISLEDYMDSFIDLDDFALFGSKDSIFSKLLVSILFLTSTSPSRVDGRFFLVASAFFGVRDLWIFLGYRVYSLGSAT